jgi:hypothetical protein
MLSLQDNNMKLLLLGLATTTVVGGVYMNNKKLGQKSTLLCVALTVGVALLVAMNLKEQVAAEEFYGKHMEKFTEAEAEAEAGVEAGYEAKAEVKDEQDEHVQPRNDAALTQNSVNSKPGPVKGPGCVQMDTVSPEDLLPNADSENIWDTPANPGDISGANFLDAGHHVGVNTVGQSLRNANRQLRSEPPNPQVKVCPWNQSTIEPDTNRLPMEIGA